MKQLGKAGIEMCASRIARKNQIPVTGVLSGGIRGFPEAGGMSTSAGRSRLRAFVVTAILPLFLSFSLASGDRSEKDVFIRAGYARLFRIEDEPQGDGPGLGAGVGLRLSPRVGIQLEFDTTLKSELRPAPCPTLECVGGAVIGLRTARLLSASGLFHFSEGVVQPYVAGGIGWLHTARRLAGCGIGHPTGPKSNRAPG